MPDEQPDATQQPDAAPAPQPDAGGQPVDTTNLSLPQLAAGQMDLINQVGAMPPSGPISGMFGSQPGPTQQPQQPPSRPSRMQGFEKFLGNFISSFAAGMEAYEPGTGKGFAAAANFTRNRDIQNQQLQQQQQDATLKRQFVLSQIFKNYERPERPLIKVDSPDGSYYSHLDGTPVIGGDGKRLMVPSDKPDAVSFPSGGVQDNRETVNGQPNPNFGKGVYALVNHRTGTVTFTDAAIPPKGGDKPDTKTEIDQRYAAIQSRPQSTWTPEEQAFIRGQDALARRNPQQAINVNLGASAPPGQTQLQGEDYLATLPPNGPITAATVRSIAEGRQPMPPAGSRNPIAVKLMNAVNTYDRSFTTERAAQRKAFTPGAPAGEVISAVNTTVDHLGVLSDMVNALQNGDVQALNAAKQYWVRQTGQAAPTNFDEVRSRIGSEIVRAYDKVGTEEDRKIARGAFSLKMSPEQLRGGIQKQIELLGGKVGSYRQQWNAIKGPGMPDFDARFLTPRARAALGTARSQFTEGGGGGDAASKYGGRTRR